MAGPRGSCILDPRPRAISFPSRQETRPRLGRKDVSPAQPGVNHTKQLWVSSARESGNGSSVVCLRWVPRFLSWFFRYSLGIRFGFLVKSENGGLVCVVPPASLQEFERNKLSAPAGLLEFLNQWRGRWAEGCPLVPQPP